MGFAGYFLIVADFISGPRRTAFRSGRAAARARARWSPGRSTITDLDPLRWGLLFERFLNPERVSMPDFDVDFCQDRRDEVIRYVQQKYGHDRVAQIITFGKLQARAVLRDVGRVLEMPYGQVDRICKLVPNNPANPVTLAQAIESEPLLRAAIAEDPAVARLIDIARKLEGLYRHASTHAAGVVIGDRPLDELVPLYRDPRSDMPVTQFNMKDVEQAGLVKFDFLGLKTLTVLTQAVKLMRRRGIDIDLTRTAARRSQDLRACWPRRCHRRVPAGKLGHARHPAQAEARPLRGPHRAGGALSARPDGRHPDLHQRQERQGEADYLHPALEPILKETYGIMVYQEQVMQIAQILSGYSLGGADLLRRAMGKKIKAEMEAQRGNFVDGAVKRDVDGRRRPRRSSTRSTSSPATASTSATPRPMRWSPTRPPISRPTIRSSSSPPR